MKTKLSLLVLILSLYAYIHSIAQTPYVYTVENTGASFAAPPLPTFANCPSIPLLPDPYKWADGSGYISGISDWSHKRAEFKAQIENYEIGTKPVVDKVTQVTATYTSGSLKVTVTANGQSMTLTCAVSIPSGATAPYPICIGMNSSYGSVTSGDFTSRGIAGITFSHDQVTTYGNPANTDPFFRLYPTQNIDNTGQYAAWCWGVSRIIDGLEKVKAAGTFNADLSQICVTGCSYAGKMALFSGAFDERVALTIAQESGGGGATSWRYSATEATGTVEGLAQTDSKWFKNSMFDFGGANVSKIPTDHHMLIAMCAPRACYCTGNTNYTWLSNPSCYVATRAAAKIYSDLGIADRFGFNIDGGHNHCAFPSDQEADATYFLDKFIKGNTSLSKTVATFPSTYSSVDYAHWYSAWGSISTNPNTLSVSATSLSVAAAASSTATFNVSSNIAWTISSNQTWLAVSPASASNNATVTVTAQQNTATSTRSATVTIAGTGVTSQTVTVTQAAASGGGSADVYLEAECGTVGSLWSVTSGPTASNSTFVTIKSGNNATTTAPADASGWITYSFTLSATGTYSVWFRTTCPDANGDSFWLKMDNGSFVTWNNIPVSTTWTWNKYGSTYSLSAGSHTFTLGYREDGAQLDKIFITSSATAPSGTGSTAINLCTPVLKSAAMAAEVTSSVDVLTYPNPVSDKLYISLSNAPSTLSIYSMESKQLLLLNTVGSKLEIDMSKYSSGIYFVKIESAGKTTTKKIVKK